MKSSAFVRFGAVVASVTVFSLAVASVQGTIDFKPKQGAKSKYKLVGELSVGATQANLNATLDQEVKVSDDKVVEVITKWSEVETFLNGEAIPTQTSDQTFVFDTKLVPQKITGGIEGSDIAQFFIASHFIPPTTAEVKVGDKYKVEVAEVKDVVPGYTYEGEYVGKEDFEGKPAHKFKGAVKLKGADMMTSDIVVWVREDGSIAKTEATFKNMDLPAAGAKVEGKVSLTKKS